MKIEIIIILLFTHFVADFIFQDEKWALGKSSSWGDLLKHTTTYSIIFFLVMCLLSIKELAGFVGLYRLNMVLLFTLITFIVHTITDYITSREVKKKFDAKKYGSDIPNLGGFTIIGFDQFLHFLQLILTYKLLFL